QLIQTYHPTIEDFLWKRVIIDYTPTILNIFDTSGNESYHTLTHQSMERGDGFLLMYSVTNVESYLKAELLWNELMETRRIRKPPIILVATKCDEQHDVHITREHGSRMAKKMKCKFAETFTALIRMISVAKNHFPELPGVSQENSSSL
ncbi:Ras GTPase, partial [Modicella reniformis]